MAGGAIQEGLINVVTQGISVAVGIQEKFDWAGVGIAAIGGGLGPINVKPTGSSFLNKVVSRSLTNLRNQGVATAVGLQDGINWAGVAASGFGYAIGDTVSSGLAGKGLLGIKAKAGSYGNQVLSGTAQALAFAATKSAIEDSNFGDNILEAMPGVIGATLGRAAGEAGAMIAAKFRSPTRQLATTMGDRASGLFVQASFEPPAMNDYVGADRVPYTGDDIIVSGDRMNWAEKAWYDVTHPSSWGGAIASLFGGKSTALDIMMKLSEVGSVVNGGAQARMESEGLRAAAGRAWDFGAVPTGLKTTVGADWAVGLMLTNPGDGVAVQSNYDMQKRIPGLESALNAPRDISRLELAGNLLGVAPEIGAAARALPRAAAAGRAARAEAVLARAAAAETVEAAAINPRLTTRLGKWRGYQAGGGELDMRSWIKATQGQEWGLGGRGGYGAWIRRVDSTHGNSLLSNRTTYLYEKVDADGNFLKWGITQDMGARELQYIGRGERGIQLFEHANGARADMARMERFLEHTQPGPQNLQPWAVKAWNSGLRRVP